MFLHTITEGFIVMELNLTSVVRTLHNMIYVKRRRACGLFFYGHFSGVARQYEINPAIEVLLFIRGEFVCTFKSMYFVAHN